MRQTFRSAFAIAILGLLASPVLGQVVLRPGGKGQPFPGVSGGMPNLVLINDQGVREELGITEAQAGKLNGLSDRLKMTRLNIKGDPMGLKKYRDAMADVKKEVDGILTPAQARRLRQLELQQRGPAALVDPQVAQDLDLTIEQSQQVAVVIEDQFKKMGLTFKDLKGNLEEIRKKTAELNKGATEKAVKVLTPAQQSKWKELAGAPYKGTLPAGFGIVGPPLRPGGALQIQPNPGGQIQIQPIQKPRE